MKKLVLKESFHDDFLKFFFKNWQKIIQIFFELGLAEIQPGLVLNLFLISEENPGWVSYKRVSYEKKSVLAHGFTDIQGVIKSACARLTLIISRCPVLCIRALFFMFRRTFMVIPHHIFSCAACNWTIHRKGCHTICICVDAFLWEDVFNR